MGQQGGQGPGRDAFDAAGLAQGERAGRGQFLAALVGKPAHDCVVEVCRQGQGLFLAEVSDISGLAIQISGVGGVDFDLLGYVTGPGGHLGPQGREVLQGDTGVRQQLEQRAPLAVLGDGEPGLAGL